MTTFDLDRRGSAVLDQPARVSQSFRFVDLIGQKGQISNDQGTTCAANDCAAEDGEVRAAGLVAGSASAVGIDGIRKVADPSIENGNTSWWGPTSRTPT